jgi:hypothetical protein
MKYLFVLFIVLFVSCKEHSTEPTLTQNNNFVQSSDTIIAKTIILSSPNGGKIVLDSYTASIEFRTCYGAELNLFCDSGGLFIKEGLYIMKNLSVEGDIASKTSHMKMLEEKITQLENKIAELESKFETTKQNF